MKSIILCSILLFITAMSCNTPGGRQPVAGSTAAAGEVSDSAYMAVSDNIRQTLKGAAFADTITYTRLYRFSSAEVQDTFELKVSPGPLATSRSELFIKTAGGKVIYSQAFYTHYLVRGIFEPDTITITGNSTPGAYNRYMLNYITAITKGQIEEYARKQIKQIFTDIFVDKQHLKAFSEDVITDTSLYNEIMNGPASRIVYMPCYDCDEGGTYLAYSAREGIAKSIAEDD